MSKSFFKLPYTPPETDDSTPVVSMRSLAGMGAMVMLVSPDGKEFWVVKGSDKWKVLKSHGYRVGGAA